jgi:hypothetical protein
MQPCFPETVVPAPQWVGIASSDDNMCQQRNIHRGRRLSELPGELYVRSAGCVGHYLQLNCPVNDQFIGLRTSNGAT